MLARLLVAVILHIRFIGQDECDDEQPAAYERALDLTQQRERLLAAIEQIETRDHVELEELGLAVNACMARLNRVPRVHVDNSMRHHNNNIQKQAINLILKANARARIQMFCLYLKPFCCKRQRIVEDISVA